jgi:hypothetical protein
MIRPAMKLFLGVWMAIGLSATAAADGAQSSSDRLFEIRTYTAAPGRLEELHQRFREHTLMLFERHGMTNVGYWSPKDAASTPNTLVYLLAHKSKAAAEKSWADFRADPEWQKVKSTSEANGSLVTKVESVFLEPTDYSPMR